MTVLIKLVTPDNIIYFVLFQLPPPNIDFTLPSPTIGLPMQSVVDPPWTPHFKAKIEEVTVNQEETVRFCLYILLLSFFICIFMAF